MIYIEDIHQPTDVYFPRTIDVSSFPTEGWEVLVTLSLRNTTTLAEWSADGRMGVEGDYLTAPLFYLEGDFDPGEWEYKITSEGVVLSSGIMKIGPSSPAPEQYDDNRSYEQYNE